ncbi:TPA: dTMP kinase [Candidatus Bathyarchaeota archaeon]|nr:dTMP kinase [Candidatus Bathyarchaeota archaeon]
MKRGFFICIEGLDKSGKTTQSNLLVEALRRKGHDAVYTFEPSDGKIGRFIREYVLNRKERVYAMIEALLFAADRTEHTETFIKPNLRKGKIVISDRYLFSSLAYQGAAGVNISWIKKINKAAVKPDLAIYLDVPVDEIFHRCQGRRSVMENREIQEKVREIYMKLVRNGELILIDGNRPVEETARDIEEIVFEKLKI